jgi:predicted GTPase
VRANPTAEIVLAELAVLVDQAERIRGRRVLVVEDGLTLTHGGMPFGAGTIAARTFEAAAILDPRPFARGSLRRVYETYSHIGAVLPAMGCSLEQVADLEQTIAAVEAELVVFATPIQLTRFVTIDKPTLRVR